MDDLLANMGEFFGNVRLADLLDVVLVGVLIYVAISWLRSGASRTVVVIIVAGVTLFVLANALDMYLTQMLLESLFAVFVITFVVLFQAEIRRELDRLAAYGVRWRKRRQAEAPQAYETLSRVAARLAQEKVGALVVLRGRESLDHVIEGGTPLGAEISEPLLCSLFNPDSPGHDGAVVVEDSRATRFGAHLPLSTNLQEVGPRGTRHTAALGLSERSDALVIVVSEERGEVSVAEKGRLQTLADPGELRGRLSAFWSQKHAPTPTRPRWQPREAGAAALALVLAAAFWLLFAYEDETVYRSWLAPVEYRNLPRNVRLERAPTEVRVTLAGSAQALRRVEARELVLTLDLTGVDAGFNRLPLEEDNLNLPGGVRLVEPEVVDLRARRITPPE